MSTIKAGKIQPPGDSDPLQIFTNTVERMRVASNGMVGIGYIAPTVLLDVAGTISAAGLITVQKFAQNNTYRTLLANDRLQLGGHTTNLIVAGNSEPGGYLEFWVNNSNDLGNPITQQNGILAMIIGPTGKVGIGVGYGVITAPNTAWAALQIAGQARSTIGTTAGSNAETLTTKNYVDTSRAFGSYVSGLVLTHVAQAAAVTTTPILTTTDIILMIIRPENLTSSNKLEVFADTFNPPTTLRQMSQSYSNTSANIILPIPKGYWWKVTSTGQNSGSTTITWMVVGS